MAAMTSAVLFVAVAVLLCATAILAILGTAQVYLSGPEAIAHDGLARGRLAPRWSLPDAAGNSYTSPSAGPLQLVIFADHSLKSFPSVVDGLRELMAGDPRLQVVVLLRHSNELAAPLLQLAGLDIPVLTGTPALYADYNVRVGPFAIFVGPDGLVRASSLVNYDWQIAKLRQLAGIPLGADEPASADVAPPGPRPRPRRRAGRLLHRPARAAVQP
jgi:hypothetical protein